MRKAVLTGVGVAMAAEGGVAADVASGRVVHALADWCPPIYAHYLYHPIHRLPSARLRALTQTLQIGG